MTLLDVGETMHRLEAAVMEARAFFGIDPLYHTPVRPDKADGAAEVRPSHGYLFAPIGVDVYYYQQHPELIRQDMAHEVAHLLSAEMVALNEHMPEEWQYGSQAAQGRMFKMALETLTVRLERLFMRERPDPV